MSNSDEIEADFDELPPEAEERLALEFSGRYQSTLKYTAPLGRWAYWTGRQWYPDDTLQIPDLIRTHCREVSIELSDDKVQRRVASAATVAAVERLARSDRRHAMRIEDWDSDPLLLNTPTGTVDLRTGSLMPHCQQDHLTKITACGPDKGCPRWLNFLQRVTDGDSGLRSFLQRVVGYCLTGDTREHAFFFLYGTGANGKSVFVRTISGILNDYATTATVLTFVASNVEHHPTDVAGLRGARLVIATETEQGQSWAESKIKSLTGGDKIAARFMRQDFFQFTPQFKLMVSGNHKPALRIVDEAIRRRLHLIPFSVTIPSCERDPNLVTDLRHEWPGILKWAIDGCLAWQQQGLNPPKVVRSVTEDYLSAEDTLGRWIEERCVLGATYSGNASELFGDWNIWCYRNGESAGSQKRFSQGLQNRKGIVRNRSRRARGFGGIALRERP